MEGNLKNTKEFQAIQIKTEYCGSFSQDNDMTILEIISELLVTELKNIFKSLEANVKNGSKTDSPTVLSSFNSQREYLKMLINKRVNEIFKESIKNIAKCYALKHEPDWCNTTSKEPLANFQIQDNDLPVIKKILKKFKIEIENLLSSVNSYKESLSYLENYRMKKEFLCALIKSKDLSERKLNEIRIGIDNFSSNDSNYLLSFENTKDLIEKKLENFFSQPFNCLDAQENQSNASKNSSAYKRLKLEIGGHDSPKQKSSKESLKLLDFLNKMQFGCNMCGKVFNQKSNLVQHQKVCFNEENSKIACKLCGKKIKLESDMRRHMKTHSNEKNFDCDECNKKFREKSDLQRHKLTHRGEQPFECSLCSERFTQKKSLVAHIRIHTGARPFNCNKCDKNFSRNDVLKSHIKRMH